MKKLHSLALCALMAPAMTLGIGSALAQTPPTDPAQAQKERAQEQQQRAQDQQQRTQDQQQRRRDAQAEQRRRDAQRAQQGGDAQGIYLSSQPANSFRADQLIGSDLKSRSGTDTIGTISDLLIDEDGQIVAIIVEVGDFLGLGEKEVAIAWDSVEHSVVQRNTGHNFTVNATKAALTNAPEFEHDEESED